ncbi:aconitase X catalytic domain-containing protein [Candidatus Bathyarchaeota archaeon]|nr:aconitase X catalytic domain-containing protein [Candidatus Bathyarchaeota archaeon]
MTKEEERIYDGEQGWAKQVCMRILVKLGDLFNAERLIPIDSAHVSGVSYKTLGDAATDFIEALANSGEKAVVKATLNPQSFDPKYLKQRLPENLLSKQQNILRYLEKMGFKPVYTCTPYYIETPKIGAHLAWAESSAVVYANSVLKAWTNREGGPSALAAAIIGKTPDYGIHRAENRRPSVLVELEQPITEEVDYGALGILLGKILKDRIPLIKGLWDISKEKLKQLGAALASTGMTNMFHYEGDAFDTKTMEKITVEADDLRRVRDELTTAKDQKPDLVFLGCPHCSINEIKQIANYLDGKKVRDDIELWICTSCHVKKEAAAYVQKIENSGAKVLTGTCAVVTWTDKLGIRTIMTNSAKTAHYAPTLNKTDTILAPLRECLKIASRA